MRLPIRSALQTPMPQSPKRSDIASRRRLSSILGVREGGVGRRMESVAFSFVCADGGFEVAGYCVQEEGGEGEG